MAGRQSRRDKQQSAFGYMVRHLYFYGQKVGPGGTIYEYRGIAKPFTLAATLTRPFVDINLIL
jgi:hypothetical protein